MYISFKRYLEIHPQKVLLVDDGLKELLDKTVLRVQDPEDSLENVGGRYVSSQLFQLFTNFSQYLVPSVLDPLVSDWQTKCLFTYFHVLCDLQMNNVYHPM